MKNKEITSQPDAFGMSVMIGDEVAYVERGYKDLKKGVIVGFTPKGFRIAENITDKYSTQRATWYVAKLNYVKQLSNEE